MEPKNNIQKHAVIAGIFVSTFYSFIIFSQYSYVDLLTEICDFGQVWNLIFWRTLFPVFIIFLFANGAKKLNPLSNQTTFLKACLNFSLGITSKILLFLFTLYVVGLFFNGISVVLRTQLYDKILFSILMILFLSSILMVLTFISSLIIAKLNQNTSTLNQTK